VFSRPTEVADSTVIKDLLLVDNPFSLRPLHDELRIVNKKRSAYSTIGQFNNSS
jgi:hypothetical protein